MIKQPPFPCTAAPGFSAPGTPLSMTLHPATAIRDADDLDEVDPIHFYQPHGYRSSRASGGAWLTRNNGYAKSMYATLG